MALKFQTLASHVPHTLDKIIQIICLGFGLVNSRLMQSAANSVLAFEIHDQFNITKVKVESNLNETFCIGWFDESYPCNTLGAVAQW